MSLPELVFRVDAGKVPGLSFGHLYRCLALERELRHSFSCRFLMAGYPEGVAAARAAGVEVTELADCCHQAVLQHCRRAPLTVIDLPAPQARLIDALEAAGTRTVVIDDTGGKDISPTLLVNGSVSETQRRYPDGASPRQRLLGPQFCILGEEFDEVSPAKAEIGERPLTLFMGGSDPAGMTAKAVAALLSGGCRLPLTVALGSGYGDSERMRQLLARYPGEHRLLCSPASVADLLRSAGLALLAGGRSAYEAAALGVPAILLPSIAHEEESARALAKAGTALWIRGAWRVEPKSLEVELKGKLEEIVSRPKLWEQMSRRGRELFQGIGRRRVARAIVALGGEV